MAYDGSWVIISTQKWHNNAQYKPLSSPPAATPPPPSEPTEPATEGSLDWNVDSPIYHWQISLPKYKEEN